jgi:hypothetical protein
MMMQTKRNFKKEYVRRVNGDPVYKKKQASRNAARRSINPPKGYQVDHINNNPLDNRSRNLKVVTKQQNLRKPKK